MTNTVYINPTKVKSIFDDWDIEEDSKVEKPKEYLVFNTPPLALVIAMQEAGKEGHEIYTTLTGLGRQPHIKADNVVSIEHQKHAAEIYDYFAKKHTLRRLKGEFVSEFMLKVDDLCDNRKKIAVENVGALISLPRLFAQNRKLEKVMKGYKSAPKLDAFNFPMFETTIEFVDCLDIKDGKNNEKHYFFSTPENYLMRIIVKKHQYGVTAWDFLVKFGKLHIKTNASWADPIKGYDFNVIHPSPDHMEINTL